MLAFTFPGQGSQRSGMGQAWVDHPSWEVAAEASEVAGRDLAALLLDADMDELTATANAQLATFVMSLVVLDAVERLGLVPAACAGHSLGEYTALVASGAVSLEDGPGWWWPAARPWPAPARTHPGPWPRCLASPTTTPRRPASGPRVTCGWPTTTLPARW